MENYIMENYIYTSHRTYIVDVMECDDGKFTTRMEPITILSISLIVT